MGMQVEKRDVEQFLIREGFTRQTSGAVGGHIRWVKGDAKVTLIGHGSKDMTKKHVAMLIRQLAQAGYTRQQVLEGVRPC